MKEKIKKALKILFTVLGVVAIFDWVIAPGLTQQNTLINILSFLLAGIISTIVGVIVWNELTENKEEESKEKEDEDGKIL
jgi:drug/metabolite transporter (DMT)-like permease